MNKKVVSNYIAEKFNLKDDINIDEKIFSVSDILTLAKDINFVRKTIQHLSKQKRQELVNLSHLSKIQRFVYSTYFNFYMKKISNNSKKKITAKIIRNYIKTYYPQYKFNQNTNKMINKMRRKAYYDVFIKKII